MNFPSVSASGVESMIFLIRGQRVMLSTDLARLYGVEPKVLIQAVKRNAGRFPPDFMFQLDGQEVARSRSQIVTLKRGQNIKYRPYAFTEQGVAMLSSVLRSERAIEINVAIMRVFVKLREALTAHKELVVKLAELEGRIAGHDENIQTLFEAIRQMMLPPEPPPKEIGFHASHERSRIVKEGRASYGRRQRVRRG